MKFSKFKNVKKHMYINHTVKIWLNCWEHWYTFKCEKMKMRMKIIVNVDDGFKMITERNVGS